MGVDRLSPMDASFLHIEDSVSHMHIASVGIFEGPEPTFDDIVAMIESKLHLVPRYRRVVRHVPLELGRPVWVDDPPPSEVELGSWAERPEPAAPRARAEAGMPSPAGSEALQAEPPDGGPA